MYPFYSTPSLISYKPNAVSNQIVANDNYSKAYYPNNYQILNQIQPLQFTQSYNPQYLIPSQQVYYPQNKFILSPPSYIPVISPTQMITPIPTLIVNNERSKSREREKEKKRSTYMSNYRDPNERGFLNYPKGYFTGRRKKSVGNPRIPISDYYSTSPQHILTTENQSHQSLQIQSASPQRLIRTEELIAANLHLYDKLIQSSLPRRKSLPSISTYILTNQTKTEIEND